MRRTASLRSCARSVLPRQQKEFRYGLRCVCAHCVQLRLLLCCVSSGRWSSTSHRASCIAVGRCAGAYCGHTCQPERGRRELGDDRVDRCHSTSRLVALLASPSVDVQAAVAIVLHNLSLNDENKITIASAGGISLLIVLLHSPSVKCSVQGRAHRALSTTVENRDPVAIAAAGGIPRFIALFALPAIVVLEEVVCARQLD